MYPPYEEMYSWEEVKDFLKETDNKEKCGTRYIQEFIMDDDKLSSFTKTIYYCLFNYIENDGWFTENILTHIFASRANAVNYLKRYYDTDSSSEKEPF